MAFNDKTFIAAQNAFLGDNRMDLDFDDTIHTLDPNYSNFYSLLKMYGGSRTVNTPVYHWFEDKHKSKTDVVPAGAANTDTAIVVSNAGRFGVSAVIRVPSTGEIMQVVAVDMATNTLTVTRAIGDTAATAIGAGATIVRIGTAYAEGTGLEDDFTMKTTDHYNYTQIFKTPLKMTNTVIQSSLRGTSNEFMKKMKRKSIEHAFDIQNAMLFGERILTTDSKGRPKRFMNGINNMITANVQIDADGVLTKDEFEAWLNDMVFAHGDEKDVFCGGIISQAINNWYDAKTTFTTYNDPKLGVQVVQYQTAKGRIKIHYLAGLDLVEEQGTALALDLSDIEIVTLNGRGTKLITNAQLRTDDFREDYLITERSVKLTNQENQAKLTGITSWA